MDPKVTGKRFKKRWREVQSYADHKQSLKSWARVLAERHRAGVEKYGPQGWGPPTWSEEQAIAWLKSKGIKA